MPPSAIRSLLRPERLDTLLAPWLPDARDRAFILRCILDEGPVHHRGANYALLALLGIALERAGGLPATPASTGASIPVPLRLPPHVQADTDEDKAYPLHLPLAPLELLAPEGSPARDALVDCLLDGPPHHALANAAMVCLLDALLQRLPPAPAPAPEAKA